MEGGVGLKRCLKHNRLVILFFKSYRIYVLPKVTSKSLFVLVDVFSEFDSN